MTDNDSPDDLDEMTAELVKDTGLLPEPARQLVHRAAAMALVATMTGVDTDAAAEVASRYITDAVRSARRGYRFGVLMFGPGGPPAENDDDEAEEVTEHVAAAGA